MPAPWAKYREAPAPASYDLYDWTNPKRPKRGTVTAMTFEIWSSIYRQSTKAPADVYNPFGRFYSAGGLASFLPDSWYVQPEIWERVARKLSAKDPNFRKAARYSKEMSGGYPLAVFTDAGEELRLTDIGTLGATYAQTPPKDSRAVADPSKADDPNKLGLNRGSLVTAMDTDAGPVMIGQNRAIDKSLVESYEGKDREIGQKEVMGASAGEAAASAGFDPKEGQGWEWLHMIAHSMGGLEVAGPQVPGNLVAGTSECNSHMIVAEEMIKKIVAAAKTKAKLFVGVRMHDTDRQIGERITYDFHIGDGPNSRVFHYEFDCLSRRPPLTILNRASRYIGLELFGAQEGGPGFVDKPFRPPSASTIAANIGLMLDADSDSAEIVARVREFGAVPAEAFYLLGDSFADGFDALAARYLPVLLGLMRAEYPHGLLPFLRGLLKGLTKPTDLNVLLIGFVVPAFGDKSKVPSDVAFQVATAAQALVGAVEAAKWMKEVGFPPELVQQVGQETTRSGDCLYEGVSIALGNPIGSHDILRRLATDFVLDNPDLPRLAGVDPDAVVRTLVTPGAWAGDAGDVAPIVLASVIRRRINVIMPGDVTHSVDPLEPPAGTEITLYLKDSHFTVHKPVGFDPPGFGQ